VILGFFVSDVISGAGYWLGLPGPGPTPLHGRISFKFLLELRLEPTSLEPLIDFLGFWVQKVEIVA